MLTFRFIILCFNDIVKVIIILSVLSEFSHACFAANSANTDSLQRRNFYYE